MNIFNTLSSKISKLQYVAKKETYNQISRLNPDLFRSSNFSAQSFLRYPLQYSSPRIEDRQNILNTAARLVGEKWGGVFPKFYDYELLDTYSLANQFKIFKGSSPETEFQDVIYFP